MLEGSIAMAFAGLAVEAVDTAGDAIELGVSLIRGDAASAGLAAANLAAPAVVEAVATTVKTIRKGAGVADTVSTVVKSTDDVAEAAGSKVTSLGRVGSLGRTPGKASETGRAVIERMRAAGDIIDDPVRGTLFRASDGDFYPLKLADMSHTTDAVTWWNSTGRAFGAKAPEVRQWMLNPDNYTLDLFSINRSAGATLCASGVRYLPPLSQ
jgi:hypothetical protein